MRKSCKYCGGIHDEDYSCPLKLQQKSRNDKISRFRNTYKWQKKREETKKRDKYLCRACLAQKKLTYIYLEVHHIVPIESDWDLRLEDENLITLCGVHHEEAESGKLSADYLRSLIPPSV